MYYVKFLYVTYLISSAGISRDLIIQDTYIHHFFSSDISWPNFIGLVRLCVWNAVDDDSCNEAINIYALEERKNREKVRIKWVKSTSNDAFSCICSYAQTISMPVRARASLFMYVYPAELIKSELGWEKNEFKEESSSKSTLSSRQKDSCRNDNNYAYSTITCMWLFVVFSGKHYQLALSRPARHYSVTLSRLLTFERRKFHRMRGVSSS